jgi:hypothetical protein
VGKEQPRQTLAGVKAHQSPFQKPLGGRRNFLFAGVWAPPRAKS